MYPNRSKIVTCPFCGAKKELMTLASGNSIGATHWSDYRVIFITNIIHKFIDVADWSKVPIVLKAELYREVGDMEKSMQVLSCIQVEELSNTELCICAGIKRRIKTGNKKVFNVYSLDLLDYE